MFVAPVMRAGSAPPRAVNGVEGEVRIGEQRVDCR
jgi:hypothetical protein